MASELVLTPGGYRSRTLVRRVEERHALRPLNGFLQPFDHQKNRFLMLDEVVEPPAEAVEEANAKGGWVIYTEWSNESGSPIRVFRTTWEVPPVPANAGKQTIFLFNGLQDEEEDVAILQPVLQWGESAIGGGPSWSVASWYVKDKGQAFGTGLIDVKEGDILVGVITLTETDGALSYVCEFEGIPGTKLSVQNVPELRTAYETLEAYQIEDCTQYPDAEQTVMSAISVEVIDGAAPLEWTLKTDVLTCDEQLTIVNGSAIKGEIIFSYRKSLK